MVDGGGCSTLTQSSLLILLLQLWVTTRAPKALCLPFDYGGLANLLVFPPPPSCHGPCAHQPCPALRSLCWSSPILRAGFEAKLQECHSSLCPRPTASVWLLCSLWPLPITSNLRWVLESVDKTFLRLPACLAFRAPLWSCSLLWPTCWSGPPLRRC